jgi:hypothetical protein
MARNIPENIPETIPETVPARMLSRFRISPTIYPKGSTEGLRPRPKLAVSLTRKHGHQVNCPMSSYRNVNAVLREQSIRHLGARAAEPELHIGLIPVQRESGTSDVADGWLARRVREPHVFGIRANSAEHPARNPDHSATSVLGFAPTTTEKKP